MQPVAARARTRHRVRSQALGDDLRLLLPAPPPPPLRPRQHLAAACALPINWQLTWQTIHLRLPLGEPPSSARRHRLQRAVKASLTLALLLLLLYLQSHILDLVKTRQDAGVDGVGNLTGLRHQLRQLLHVGERMLERALGEFGRP